jgi:thiamine pyrophosphokinase
MLVLYLVGANGERIDSVLSVCFGSYEANARALGNEKQCVSPS